MIDDVEFYRFDCHRSVSEIGISDKIRIRNYGPLGIGTSELDGGSLTVPKFSFFIGDQGTGKSTVAKLISTLSWTEKAMVRKTIEPNPFLLRDFQDYC